MTTTTTESRTMSYIRRKGGIAGLVQMRITLPDKSSFLRDLFGFGDVYAIWNDYSYIIQCTAVGDVSTRIKKITLSNPKGANEKELKKAQGRVDACRRCLLAGVKVQVWGWKKPKEAGGKWGCRIVDISLEDLK